jgi:hypothetical protein
MRLRRLDALDRFLTQTATRYIPPLVLIAVALAGGQTPLYLLRRIHYNPVFTGRELAATFCAASLILFLSGSAIATGLILALLIATNLLKFYYLREGLIPSDFVNWQEAFFSGGIVIQAVMVAAFVTALATLWHFSNRRHLAVRVAGVTVWALVAATAYARPAEIRTALLFDEYVQFWRPTSEFQRRGFFVAFATAAVDRRQRSLELEHFALLDAFPQWDIRAAPLGLPGHRPDIHVVLLESFIEPHDFTKLRYDREPGPAGMTPLLAQRAAAGYSPVFGGKSAKAEFEVLCGVPDFDLLGNVTFNQMGSSHADCLPNLLRRAGYRTIVTTPTPGDFFSIKRAYRAVGFDERLLAESFVFDETDGPYLANGSALRQSTDLVRQRIAAAPERPLFSYVVLGGGHFPFERNEVRRPDRIRIAPTDAVLTKVVNMSHYTLLALERYLLDIQRLERDSIVVLFADHLPPVSDELLLKGGYRGFDPARPVTGRRTFLLVLRNGTPVPVGNIALFELPGVLVRMVSGTCQIEGCAPSDPLLLRLPGVYQRSAPADDLCPSGVDVTTCHGATARVNEMRGIYQHLVRQSTLPEAPTGRAARAVAGRG